MVGVDDRTPVMVAKSLSEEIGVKKVTDSWWRIFILGMLAGVYIGFGAGLSTVVTCDLAKYTGLGFARFMGGSAFSVGLMLVIIVGAELFTGNNLMMISALNGKISWGKLLERWGLVYLANFVGSIILVWIMYGSGVWKIGNFAVGAKALNIANAKVNLSWVEAFCRGIGCNWLVCLAVWMALSSRNVIGKIFAIYFPVMTFVASGFEHSVANMYFIPLGIYLKGHSAVAAAADLAGKLNDLTWKGFWIKNEIPVTLGNIVGGAFFVSFIYWLVLHSKSKE